MDPLGLLGLGLTAGIAVVALCADLIAPGDPFRAVAAPLQPPSARHWFGTDDLGRDLLAQVVHGSRASLLVGLQTAVLSATIGATVGGLAGYFGRGVDDALMRLTEFFQVLPRFFVAVVVAALFGARLPVLILLLGCTFWPGPARLVRAQVLALRSRDFVVAARATGASHGRVLLRHLLPNAAPPLVVSAALQVGGAIITEASLSFLGLGDRANPSWGYLLNVAQPFLRTAWWMSAFPGLALSLTVLGVNLLADSANDAWNPRVRGGG